MRQSIKAALFSALVFPGSGHFVLRKHLRGALLAGIAFVSLCVLVNTLLEIALQIFDEILSGQIPLDSARLTEEAVALAAADDSPAAAISTWLLIACWLIGIVDSFREGWLEDQRDKEPGDTQPD